MPFFGFAVAFLHAMGIIGPDVAAPTSGRKVESAPDCCVRNFPPLEGK